MTIPSFGSKEEVIERIMEHEFELAGGPELVDEEEEPVDDSGAREGELSRLTVKTLKKFCRQRSLKVSGNKAELVRRLVDSEKEEQQGEEWDEEDDEKVGAEALDALLASPTWKSPGQRFADAVNQVEVDFKALEDIFRMEQPKVGSIVSGVVSSVIEFGAFVRLQDSGWSGLLHVSEIADEYIDKIEDYVQPGDNITCVVIPSFGDRLDRISLSLKRMPAKTEKIDPDLSRITTLVKSSRTTSWDEKRAPLLEKMENLQVRIGALEALLQHIGHEEELQAAQVDKLHNLHTVSPAAEAPRRTPLAALDASEDDGAADGDEHDDLQIL